ncbi:MAG TPA: DNA polymerase III subunit delta [Solirubrobacterales bacterium]|nr:DNA polymerase III subunit delta [Solirubrobacterales bacterium]
MAELNPAYLIAGTDEAKIDAAVARLRARAEADGGPGALEEFMPADGGAPDAAALIASIPALSLTATHRYLLADHVERWPAAQAGKIASALASLGPNTTVVLVARGKAPAKLGPAVKKAGGEALTFDAPRERDLPQRLVADAAERGFTLELPAARLLVERMGTSTVRLANELDRLALWAGPDGEVTLADLEAMVADTSEAATWGLSDSLIERRPADAVLASERLIAQGESVSGLVYALARRLRQAQRALVALEAGRSPKEITSSLDMHPYAAKMLLQRLRGSSLDDVRDGIATIAALEIWCRGGSDYDERVALTLAVRRAAGAEPAGV